MQPNMVRYQPTYDDVKATLGLSDEQLSKLKQMQQDKMTATQNFYTKMADKQKELNALLESNSGDATKVGQLMLDLQQLRKQQPPGMGDIHEHAVEVLTADQKRKLERLEEAQKMRASVDQALQLGLLSPPPPPPVTGRPVTQPGNIQPMTSGKGPAGPKQ